MSIVFASFTSHPPLLLPTIGKGAEEKLEKTHAAMEQLERELYLAKPQVLVIISPHVGLFRDVFVINAHSHFISDFEQLGDLTTKLEWNGIPELAAKIRHKINLGKMQVRLVSSEKLDHGCTIPLLYLTKHLGAAKILPLGFSEQSPVDHLKFGKLLKECLAESEKRIAIIGSGDLAHTLTDDSPAGFHEFGKEFDRQLKDYLEQGQYAKIVNFNSALIKNAVECGYRSLLILLGILNHSPWQFNTLCYEAPFGVGYLTGYWK